jgi:hypothetical protein
MACYSSFSGELFLLRKLIHFEFVFRANYDIYLPLTKSTKQPPSLEVVSRYANK